MLPNLGHYVAATRQLRNADEAARSARKGCKMQVFCSLQGTDRHAGHTAGMRILAIRWHACNTKYTEHTNIRLHRVPTTSKRLTTHLPEASMIPTSDTQKPRRRCAGPSCPKTFEVRSHDKKYCSARCRLAAWDATHPRLGAAVPRTSASHCKHCAKPLDAAKRRGSQYCNAKCRAAHYAAEHPRIQNANEDI